MDAKIKKLWVDALRSGAYIQGRHELKTDEAKHCCMGVLAEELVKNGVEPYCKVIEVGDAVITIIDDDEGTAQNALPGSMAEELLEEGKQDVLVQMNDGDYAGGQYSFEEIANYIEENL